MFLFGKNKNPEALRKEVAGIKFRNPVGVSGSPCCVQAGFITLSPPSENVLEWVSNLQEYKGKALLAVNLHSDIVRSFSLVYDFADLIILDPDSDNGIDSPDIADTSALVEEVVSLRLCYEQYTPIFLRFSHAVTPDELHPLLDLCRLSGIDGAVVPSLSQLERALTQTKGRYPVIGMADSPEKAQEMLLKGACLVETNLRPTQVAILLKTLEKK